MSHPLGDDKPFELDILKITCYIGLGRILVAVYNDFNADAFSSETALHVVLLLIFVLPLILSRTRIPIQVTATSFAFVLMTLLGLNWLVSNGLEGSGAYPMMMMFLLVIMVLRGWVMIAFTVVLLLLQVGLMYLDQHDWQWVANFKNAPSVGSSKGMHFLLMSVIAMVATVYVKDKFERERLTLKKKGRNLKSKLLEIDAQNRILLEQKNELEQIKELLEEKVKERSLQLAERNLALAQYWKVSASEISQPLKITVRSINDIKMNFKDQHELINMLSKSGQELLESIKNVVKELETEPIMAPDND